MRNSQPARWKRRATLSLLVALPVALYLVIAERLSPWKPVTLIERSDWVRSIAFSPDGTWMATAAPYKTVRLWHVPTRTVRQILGDGKSRINSIAFSPDGALLADTNSGGKILFWDVTAGQPQQSRAVALVTAL